MRVITGIVVDGKVELPAESLAEGAHVMVLALEAAEPVHLSPAEEQELLEAMEQIRAGEYVDGDDLLLELRSRCRGLSYQLQTALVRTSGAAHTPFASDHFNSGRVARRPGDPSVPSNERSPEDFGQGHIDSVIGGEVLAQLPSSREEEVVGIAFAREVHEILEGLAGALESELTARHETTQNLGDLDVEQMRRVKRGFPGQERLGKRFAPCRLE
jgi:hypothetical protein